MVFPDTSPRDTNIEGIKDDWSFGEGAGYYVDATAEKYKKHFNMYTHITKELPEVIKQHFHVDTSRSAITGFSMGGLGALNCALKNPGMYKSVSAFAPISNPCSSKWGMPAYEKFMGSTENGKEYDPTLLISGYQGPTIPMLVDQGSSD